MSANKQPGGGKDAEQRFPRLFHVATGLGAVLLVTGIAFGSNYITIGGFGLHYTDAQTSATPPTLDKEAYDRKLLQLAYGTTTLPADIASSTDPSVILASSTAPWPVHAPYPNYGAILPFNRIVAYYGNFYSKQMGVLGEYPEDEMLARLQDTVLQWKAADPSTPVIPAIHYIAVTAQASAGKDGKYRARMPDSQIEKALALADKVHGLVFLDLQVGLSSLPEELPLLEKYLALPNVELGIDPEFAMHGKEKPGSVVGSYDATDINYAAQFLAKLVNQNNIPPKILMIHRFTMPMVTNYQNIEPLPQVQIVMDMDGWGTPARKINTYQLAIRGEPVQFTGFKLFYKNDIKPPSDHMLTPQEVLELRPQPIYIQYQ